MMPLCHGWNWYQLQTASQIWARHIQSVWAIDMLSQGLMGAPLYQNTGQVGPGFRTFGSLVELKWCHYPMVEADNINLRLLLTYIHIRHILSGWGNGMLYHGHMDAPSYRYTGQGCPQFRNFGSHVEWKWCHYIMVEADIHLSLLPTSILDINNVFETLVCCRKGIWAPPYIIIPAKFSPDFGIWVTCGVK